MKGRFVSDLITRTHRVFRQLELSGQFSGTACWWFLKMVNPQKQIIDTLKVKTVEGPNDLPPW